MNYERREISSVDGVFQWVSEYCWKQPEPDFTSWSAGEKSDFNKDMKTCINLLSDYLDTLRTTPFDRWVNHAGGAASFGGGAAMYFGMLTKFAPVLAILGAAAAATQYTRNVYKQPKIDVLEARLLELKILDKRFSAIFGLN